MIKQLTLANDQVDLLRQGSLSRVAIFAHPGDYFETTGPDAGRLMTVARTVRFTTDDMIRIHTPLQKDVMQVRFTGLAGTNTVCRYIFDISDTELRFFGHSTLSNLWMEWVERYDAQAAWWWRTCETLIDTKMRDRIFRKFLKTRMKDHYMAWVLVLDPMADTVKETA
jgi:hypothetical protein